MLQVCEHYIARGMCSDFPDWSIGAPGSEKLVKIGYDYGRSVTGMDQEVEVTEDAAAAIDSDPLCQEMTLVATSGQV